jgi:hypothetical protein
MPYGWSAPAAEPRIGWDKAENILKKSNIVVFLARP